MYNCDHANRINEIERLFLASVYPPLLGILDVKDLFLFGLLL